MDYKSAAGDPIGPQRATRRIALGALVAAATMALPAKRAEASGAVNNVIYATSYGVVADGVTNDAVALQNAINAMGNGYVLVLPAGTMALGSSGWTGIVVSGLTNIRIEGYATGIKWLAAPSQTTGPIGATGLRIYNCTEAVISDLEINGNAIVCIGLGLDTCTGCTVSHVEAYSHAGNGQFAACRGAGNTWQSCSAHNAIASSACRGFLLGNGNSGYGETDLTVRGCSAESNDATGFGIEAVRAICVGNFSASNGGAGYTSATNTGSPSTDHLFVGNVGRANNFHGYQTDVFGGVSAQRITLIGNTFSDNAQSGIQIASGADITIVGNVLSGNGSAIGASALILYDSTGVVVSENVIEGDATYGTCISAAYPTNTLSDVIITTNRCVGSTQIAVNLQTVDGSSSIRRLILMNNLVYGGSYGLYLRTNVTGGVIDNVTISGNIIEAATSSSYYFYDLNAGQTTNLRLLGNAGDTSSFNSNILPVQNSGNTWNPGVTFGSAAPSDGTWPAGSIIQNTSPAAGGYAGWICVAGGSPGTWKPFALIST